MPLDAPDHLTELERQTNYYLGLIRRIDAILEGPVKALITTVGNYAVKTGEGRTARGVPSVGFPVWISEDVQPETTDYLFTKSLCFFTLQKISRFERRFAWLDKDYKQLLGFLTGDDHNLLIESLNPETGNFDEGVAHLTSRTFGALNPLTASQVFHVLLNAGESRAHDGRGFLAFFAMIWPLRRSFPDRQSFGAAIEPWQPKAYVTARCILPIKTLQEICTERAALLSSIGGSLETLEHLSRSDVPRDRWLFSAELDELTSLLSRLARIAIERDALRNCAKEVEQEAQLTSQDSKNGEIYNVVLKAVVTAFQKLGEKGVAVLSNARSVVEEIRNRIADPLTRGSIDERLAAVGVMRSKLKMKFAREYLDSPDHRESYLNDLSISAQKGYNFCKESLEELLSSCADCAQKMKGADLNRLKESLESLAESNQKIAKKMDLLVRDATAWCRSVMDREIAHASAKNITDFDPSELVSAIAVAVRWKQMTTTLQVKDAVSKALAGAREDGSWSPGQPFYSPNNAAGIWPVTSDIVWTLTSAIQHQPQVDVADEVLFRFIDWLERTKVELRLNFEVGAGNTSTDGQMAGIGKILEKIGRRTVVGWASDRLRHPRKIHFATTAFSINALFEIRDLVEYRLWQLCEKRFNVLSIRSPLKDISPVDLGARHKHRLHSRLSRTVRVAQGKNYNDAEYSLILHGPPGSSKTVIAEALSTEMWDASARWGDTSPRLVRITPADFTRLGEDRLDSEARLIFDLISGVRGATIFFDEIDDLLRQRGDGHLSFMGLVVPAMLNRLADLRKACPQQEICFLLATNYVDNIEPALIRKGRIDGSIAVVYPDYESRLSLTTGFTRKLETKLGAAHLELCRHIASITPQWPYMTLKAACESVVKVIGQLPDSKGRARVHLEKKMKDIASATINQFGSSFTKPDYNPRSKRWNNRFSRELLNEYLHNEISGPSDFNQFRAYRQITLEGEDYKSINLYDEIELISKNEERFGLNGSK